MILGFWRGKIKINWFGGIDGDLFFNPYTAYMPCSQKIV